MFKFQAKEIILILIFAIVVMASGADLVADLSHGADSDHVAKEAVIITLSLFAIAWLLSDLHRQKLEIMALQKELKELDEIRSSAEEYVLEGRKKLGSVISKQFAEWMLTESETEVGWLLLKGLSLKEIAMLRNTLEKTVRQQASSIYKKSGIQGRHAFSAWFIEDIL